MLTTTNYGLKKIELKDSPPDITVINPNWDFIDQMMKTLHDSTNTWDNFKASGGTIGSLQINSESTNVSEDKFITSKDILSLGSDKMGVCLDGQSNSLRPFGSQSGLKTLGVPGAEWKDMHMTDIGSVKTELSRKGYYEWGWWTPVLYTSQGWSYAITANTSGSHYFRIGNIIKCFFNITVTNWNTAWGTYLLLLRGFPYTPSKAKAETGGINLYSGIKSGGNVNALSIAAHDSAGVAWIKRCTDTVTNDTSLNMLEQSFKLTGWYEFSI